MYFTSRVKASYYDCDCDNRLKISAAMQYMQQTSSEHLEALGMPYQKLYAENMVFLLSKMCIKVHRMPVNTQEMIVGTAPINTRGARFVREFIIESTDGERMISALSLWLLVDPHTRRILRPASFPYPLPYRDSLIDGVIDDMRMPGLLETGERLHTEVQIRYSHIDCNRHVNNCAYADFVCDALPHDELTGRGIDTLVISYQNEAKWGDTLEMTTSILSQSEYYVAGEHGAAPCFEALVQLCDFSLAHRPE